MRKKKGVMVSVGHRRKRIQVKFVKNNIMNKNNLLLIINLTIKTYLQLISLKKKKTIQSKHFLQIISFYRLLFILIKKFI